jgi:hypothetical protein
MTLEGDAKQNSSMIGHLIDDVKMLLLLFFFFLTCPHKRGEGRFELVTSISLSVVPTN